MTESGSPSFLAPIAKASAGETPAERSFGGGACAAMGSTGGEDDVVDLTEGPSPQLSPVFLPKPRPKAQGKKKSELVTAESIAPEAIAKLKRNDMQFDSLTIKQMQAIGMVHFLKEPKEMAGKNKAAVAAILEFESLHARRPNVLPPLLSASIITETEA